MSSQTPRHPLDIDLLDYVEGKLDEPSSASLAAHLRVCVLCRIKQERLANAPPMDIVDAGTVPIPQFERFELEDASGSDARPGELWLTASDEAAMVLVKATRSEDNDLVVVPVSFDIEAADQGALVLEAPASPLPIPIVVYEDLVLTLPARALDQHLTSVRIDVLGLREGDPGVSRGVPLSGPDDPRLEVRRDLADRIVVSDPEDIEDRVPRDGASRIASLQDGLLFRRGPECIVEELVNLPRLADTPADWTGVAYVRDFTVRVIVIETPSGLRDDRDVASAQAVITRLDGSALAVCQAGIGEVDLYDAPTLFRAFRLPDGKRTSAPLISGLSLLDTVAKYLDQKRVLLSTASTTSHRAPRVDVREIVREATAAAVDATVKRAPRLAREKRPGYEHLESKRDQLAELLTKALEPDFDPESVARIIESDRP